MESEYRTQIPSDHGQEPFIKLKCDLHTHIVGDRWKDHVTSQNMPPADFIDRAVSMGFEVLSFTYHDFLYHDPAVWAHAKERGVVLVPGIERSFDRRHVLLYNCPHAEAIEGLRALRHYRRLFPQCLVIAPHPFYKGQVCLGRRLVRNIDCFDAIEYCHFYTRFFNPNRTAVRVAKRFSIPMVGCSDAHRMEDFASTYSYIYARERSVDGVIEAVKAGRVEYVTTPLPLKRFFSEVLWILTRFSYVLKGEYGR
ncbi:MAG: PHP-associated domain-containing protein [bacterium]